MPDAHALTLRTAGPTDAVALARLGRDSFMAKFGAMYREADSAHFLAASHCAPVVAAEIANPAYRIMLAEDGGALVGFCKVVLETGWPEHARGERAIELKQLYTAPDATGQGIGAALIEWALATARDEGADEVQLSVWSGNHGAQRFYRRYGFEKVADIEFWVGEQCDEEFLFAKML